MSTHRPWPIPARPWTMAQVWHDLLFMHWPLPPAALQPLLPPGLPLDRYDGQAWLGIVPFWMSGVRPSRMPSLPWVSTFAELNVRAYVTRDGRPGVYFFSLDAANPIAVAVARALYHLPYYHARMRVRVQDERIDYASRRIHPGAPPAAFAAVYGPTGPPAPAAPGSLADWLTARYCLYTTDRRGRLRRQEIDHRLWPLQPAAATISANSMAAPLGLTLPATPPLLHFSRRLDVVVWPQERLPAIGPPRQA